MPYRVWSASGLPNELPNHLFGRQADEWLKLPRNTKNVNVTEFKEFWPLYNFVQEITREFAYDDIYNWPVIMRNIQRKLNMAVTVPQESGVFFCLAVVWYELPDTGRYDHMRY